MNVPQCTACVARGYGYIEQQLYECGLCGDLYCDDHMSATIDDTCSGCDEEEQE